MTSSQEQTSRTRRTPQDGSNLGSVITAYMETRGIGTHTQMAEILGVDRTLVSKYVSGSRQCHDMTQLRQFAEAMDLPTETFGLLPPPADESPVEVASAEEAQRWQLVRRTLNRHRSELTQAAAALYWDPARIGTSACLTRPEWTLAAPLPLDSVELTWLQETSQVAIEGSEPLTEPYRPSSPTGTRYARYSQAIRALAAPSLFENRGSYRLLDMEVDETGARMAFGYTTYFDMVDVCETLGHELAAAWIRASEAGEKMRLKELPFRQEVGDLFDLSQRAVLPSVNTLTIRRGADGDTFFLHRRGASQVAVAGGQSHVIPAGVFQPSGIAPWNMAGDFDLWRNLMREYSEELLGNPEHDGSSGAPIDYREVEPFRTLDRARRAGKVRPWLLGVGFDPLVPAGEILTATVFDSDVFDEVFADRVTVNADGQMVPSVPGSVGIPWSAQSIQRVRTEEPLACAAAACIELTWKHRRVILAE